MEDFQGDDVGGDISGINPSRIPLYELKYIPGLNSSLAATLQKQQKLPSPVPFGPNGDATEAMKK